MFRHELAHDPQPIEEQRPQNNTLNYNIIPDQTLLLIQAFKI